MRCRTCQMTFRGPFRDSQKHHWDKQQCAECHYLGLRKNKRFIHGHPVRGQSLKSRKFESRPKIMTTPVTKENIEIYQKVSLILRGKTIYPKVILNNRYNILRSSLVQFMDKSTEECMDMPDGIMIT